jgi:hypothetical protein
MQVNHSIFKGTGVYAPLQQRPPLQLAALEPRTSAQPNCMFSMYQELYVHECILYAHSYMSLIRRLAGGPYAKLLLEHQWNIATAVVQRTAVLRSSCTMALNYMQL